MRCSIVCGALLLWQARPRIEVAYHERRMLLVYHVTVRRFDSIVLRRGDGKSIAVLRANIVSRSHCAQSHFSSSPLTQDFLEPSPTQLPTVNEQSLNPPLLLSTAITCWLTLLILMLLI